MEKKILYFGRIATYKGVHNVIKAMPKVVKLCPEACLYIRGQVSTGNLGNYHKKLLMVIGRSGVKDRIFYSPGWISEAEKKRLIKEADVIVCPSLSSEGFGLIPIEALKINGIVVSSDLFAETGSVNKKAAFVYPRNSIKALAQQIIKALSLSPQQRREKKKEAEEWASNFTWSKHVDELEKIFEALVKRKT